MRADEGTAMIVVDSVPVDLDEAELIPSLKLERLKQREKDVPRLVEKALALIQPRAVYRYMKVTSIEDELISLKGGFGIKSTILADVLKEGQEICPHVATIGPQLEEEASRLASRDVFCAWVLEKIGDYATTKVALGVKSRAAERLGTPMSSFGPGTGTGRLFGIEQQRVLFRMLEPENNIGVRLMPSLMMIPRKSVSGVLAATRREYVACQYCPRRCDYRNRPFIGEYATMYCEHKVP